MGLMSNIEKYPKCPMRTSLGNCDCGGGFCTSVKIEVCNALHNAYQVAFLNGQKFEREQLKKGDSTMRYLIKEVKHDKNWKAITTITETTLKNLNTLAHYFDENAFGTQRNELTLLEANDDEMLFFLQKINH